MAVSARFVALGVAISAMVMAACSGAGGDAESASEGVLPALDFHAEAAPLASFSYDTGLLPATGPARAQLKLSAGGGLKLDATAVRGEKGLEGKPGGGKLAIDVHVKMAGRLVVDSPFVKFDGELPGLKNIDIPIAGAVPFDGLLVGAGESAEARADVPETTLPEIPLGSVPGSLVITVAKGSVLTSKFHGTCLGVARGEATYAGESTTSGTLVLRAKIVLKLPPPLDKSIDLPEMKVAIPALTSKLASSLAVTDLADSARGACAASGGAPEEGSSSGGSSSGGSSSGGSSSGGSSSGGSSSGGSSSGGSSSGGIVPSTFAVTVNGVPGVPGKIVTGVETLASGIVRKNVYLYFTAPGLTAPTRVIVSASSTGSGCATVANTIVQGVEYQPVLVGASLDFRSTPFAGACGLTVNNVGSRMTGTYIGTMLNQGGFKIPASQSMTLTFDVALP